MSPKIVFARILRNLMDDRYKRNRAALAEAACVSPSALSQYVRGRATPSLDVLVHLAEILDVSLDYLVFGKEQEASPPELGYFAGYIEAHIQSRQAQAASLHDLVARLGSRLADKVKSTAEELLSDAEGGGGTLRLDEISVLERCSTHTTIVTIGLDREVLLLSNEGSEDVTAPSIFGQIIVDNLTEGATYEYILPQGSRWIRAASMLRHEILSIGGFDASFVDRHLRFVHVSGACVPGYVVQHIAVEKLRRRAPDIAERIAQFTYPDSANGEMGFLAYIEPGSAGSEHFNLIAQQSVPRLLEELHAIRRSVR